MRLPIAFDDLAAREHDLQRFDVLDERRVAQAAPVDVRADGSAERQAVRTGLFLSNAPAHFAAVLLARVIDDELRPSDARLRSNEPAFAIELEHSVQRSRVEQPSIASELLTAHRVASARNREHFAAFANRGN